MRYICPRILEPAATRSGTLPTSMNTPTDGAKDKWLRAVEQVKGGDLVWGGGGGLWGAVVQQLGDLLQDSDESGDRARVAGLTSDGGMDVKFDENWVAQLESEEAEDDSDDEADDSSPPLKQCPEGVEPLNIVIMVVGTRGDVQPFIALGRGLTEFGHRVRLASHSIYRDFVTSFGLEFYPLGGDPKVLSEFVVKNRGVLPRNPGDIPENRQQLREIVDSTYGACCEPDYYGDKKEFMADAIISNPPALGHIHCAEKFKIPLHMMFTMPWTKTKEFMHPLARNTRSMAEAFTSTTKFFLGDKNSERMNRFVRRRMNRDTYSAVENIMFLGMKDIIDDFRQSKDMGLEPTGLSSEQRHIIETKKVPFTYCWSPSFVPKPKDWGDHIDIVGFFFLNESSLKVYNPPEALANFLEAGDPPIYIGFGSMVIPDAKAVNKCIEEAVQKTGVRALVSKGWGGLGEDINHHNVFQLESCPHDWLFPRCAGVVHHGGAGTTAAGLLAGCPTFVVPFFGDQPFWGEACHKSGVGPKPVAIDDLTSDAFIKAFENMRSEKTINRVKEVAEMIKAEDGVKLAVDAFHRHLPPMEDIRNRRMDWSL